MKKTLISVLAIMFIAVSLLSGTFALYATKLDDLASGSVIAKDFVITADTESGFEENVLIAPSEKVIFHFSVSDFSDVMVSEVNIDVTITVTLSPLEGKSPIENLTMCVKNSIGNVVGTGAITAGVGTITVLDYFRFTETGTTKNYTVEIYWPSNEDDVLYEGHEFGNKIGVEILGVQCIHDSHEGTSRAEELGFGGGEGTLADPFEIWNAVQFGNMSKWNESEQSYTFIDGTDASGVYYKIMNNIDLGDVSGSKNLNLGLKESTLDGNGFTVTVSKMDEALFDRLDSSTVKNLTFDCASMGETGYQSKSNTSRAAVVASVVTSKFGSDAVFENVHMKNLTIVSPCNYVGSIAACSYIHNGDVIYKDCSIEEVCLTSTSKSGRTGGFSGLVRKELNNDSVVLFSYCEAMGHNEVYSFNSSSTMSGGSGLKQGTSGCISIIATDGDTKIDNGVRVVTRPYYLIEDDNNLIPTVKDKLYGYSCERYININITADYSSYEKALVTTE